MRCKGSAQSNNLVSPGTSINDVAKEWDLDQLHLPMDKGCAKTGPTDCAEASCERSGEGLALGNVLQAESSLEASWWQSLLKRRSYLRLLEGVQL